MPTHTNTQYKCFSPRQKKSENKNTKILSFIFLEKKKKIKRKLFKNEAQNVLEEKRFLGWFAWTKKRSGKLFDVLTLRPITKWAVQWNLFINRYLFFFFFMNIQYACV